jgi:hypothetical protein
MSPICSIFFYFIIYANCHNYLPNFYTYDKVPHALKNFLPIPITHKKGAQPGKGAPSFTNYYIISQYLLDDIDISPVTH